MDWVARGTVAQSVDNRVIGVLGRHKMHPLVQGGQWRSTGYGDAQLRTCDIHESELVNQSLAMLLGNLPPLMARALAITVSTCARAASLARCTVTSSSPKVETLWVASTASHG
jgi:hypothetical protein